MQSSTEKLSTREKIGYGFGDAAANFVFQTMLIFQLGFYTDVFGLTAATAGTLLLVGRFWDAVFDPFMGVIADSVRPRPGIRSHATGVFPSARLKCSASIDT